MNTNSKARAFTDRPASIEDLDRSIVSLAVQMNRITHDFLVLLCSKHHALLHEGGFTIEKDYRDRWFFRRPDGRAVPACGYRLDDVTDDDVGTVDEYFGEDTSAGGVARFRGSVPNGRGGNPPRFRGSAPLRHRGMHRERALRGTVDGAGVVGGGLPAAGHQARLFCAS